jgi:diguanylate cyclase (GGDEF)-like protein
MMPQFFILVALLFTSMVLCAALFIAWRHFERPRHALVWAYAYLVGVVQWSCNLFQNLWFDDRRVYWVVVNAIPLAIVALGLIGHRLRVGWSNNWRTLLVLALGVEAAVVWFTMISPHVGLNMALQPAFAGALLLAMSYTLWRGGRMHAAELSLAVANGAFGVVLLASATAALMQGANGNAQYLSWYVQINFLLLPSGYVASGVFTVLLLAADLSDAMRRLALTDQLTQLLNRRGFDRESQRLVERARQSGSALGLVLADIDRFKSINDRHGHEAGDRAIARFAELLAHEREVDAVLSRLGGEEFALVVANHDAQAATGLAERIRMRVEADTLTHGEASIRLTASFGVATLAPTDRDVYDVLRRADRALYLAKEQGRNRVVATV